MKVFILTEGGRNIGFGHITRCSAIYDAFKEKGITPQILVNADNGIKGVLADRKYKLFDWLNKINRLAAFIKGADIVIIDSYLAGAGTYKTISKMVKSAVYIDDNNRIVYPEGVIVNGAIYAGGLKYPKRKGVSYLLGTGYMPLGKEFWSVPNKPIRKKINTIIVTFGGGDLKNMMPKVLKLLAHRYPEQVKRFIIGRGFKNIEHIERAKDCKAKLIYYPDTRKMKNVMLKSDIAISAGGQTLYELARIGVPTVAVAIARNQLNNVKRWEAAGFIEYAGYYTDRGILSAIGDRIARLLPYATRLTKSKNGKDLIDGHGAGRLCAAILRKLS